MQVQPVLQPSASRRLARNAFVARRRPLCHRRQIVRASTQPEVQKGTELENPESEIARKKSEAERLRAAEKFMVIGSGEATCTGCGYEFRPEKGDPDFPIAKGIKFEETPADYQCPICGAPREKFQSRMKVVAGFAENQKYGFGTNSMTGAQKLAIIYGALLIFFVLFIAGYALE